MRVMAFGRGAGHLLTLSVMVFTGCGERTAQPTGAIRSDSAGVTIVDNRTPAWGDSLAWTIGEPDLIIGTADGPPETQFASVVGITRLADGAVVVADDGLSELRYFRADGSFLGSVGGKGEGPGEFRVINAVGHTPGDSVWVYDFALRRVTVFPTPNDLPVVHPLESPVPTLGAAGRLEDGSYVLAQYWGSADVSDVVTEGLRRDPAAVLRYDRFGRLADTVGFFPGREVALVAERGRMVMGAPLFGRTLSRVAAGRAVFVGSQEAPAIEQYGGDGTLQMIIRFPDPGTAIDEADLRTAREARVAASPPARQAATRSFLDAIEHAPAQPAYGQLLVDGDGRLWVAEYRSDESAPREWWVFAPDGRWLGAVRMPEDFRPHEIGFDVVVGVSRDALGVESVRVHPILRPDPR